MLATRETRDMDYWDFGRDLMLRDRNYHYAEQRRPGFSNIDFHMTAHRSGRY